jgi:hypothetical protein
LFGAKSNRQREDDRDDEELRTLHLNQPDGRGGNQMNPTNVDAWIV